MMGQTTPWIFLLTAAVALNAVTGFAPIQPFRRASPSTSTSLKVSWWDSDEESRRTAMHHNIMRTDLRNFLTQRSLQSFMTLCQHCRDPHTVKWLEDFGDLKNLDKYHGTGALNVTRFPTWSSFLTEVMHQPEEAIIVSQKVRDRGGNVGFRSKTPNPYIKDRYIEFTIDIDPPSLAARILSVREQIAAEWVDDLDTLKVTNDMVLDNYNEKIKKARSDEGCSVAGDYDHDKMEGCIKPGETNKPQVAFDRNGMYFLRNSNAFCSGAASSPLRQSNFDLLCLLATQESVHRVLRDYVDAGKQREVSFQWFRDFYVARVAKYFDGCGEHGRSDDFLEELLLTAPSLKSSDDGKMGLVDPLRIAENIIETRSRVATEWKEAARMSKDEHTTIRKELLELQMVKWGRKPAIVEPILPEGKEEVKPIGKAWQTDKNEHDLKSELKETKPLSKDLETEQVQGKPTQGDLETAKAENEESQPTVEPLMTDERGIKSILKASKSSEKKPEPAADIFKSNENNLALKVIKTDINESPTATKTSQADKAESKPVVKALESDEKEVKSAKKALESDDTKSGKAKKSLKSDKEHAKPLKPEKTKALKPLRDIVFEQVEIFGEFQ